MLAFGKAIAEGLRPGMTLYLQGTLGMGKTTLSRGIVHALGATGAVKSPTYTLVEPYQLASFPLYHFDLYRLGDPEELEFMGIRDYFDGRAVCLVEWPMRGQGVLPAADIVITIGEAADAAPGRDLLLEAGSAAGEALLQSLGQGGAPGAD